MNILKKLKKLVGQTAPILAGALNLTGGGAAIGMIANALGVGDDPEKMIRAIEENPELALKFKTVEIENKTRLQEIALKLDLAYLEDRQDARSREENILADGGNNLPMYILGGIITVGFITFSIMVVLGKVGEDTPLVMLVAGALIAKFSDVVSYFFGSSKSSNDKTQMLGGAK